MKPFRLLVVEGILKNYHYDQPFHLYFSELCKQNRNWGSKDRKIYKNLAYAYFRLGNLNEGLELKQGIQKAVDLLNQNFVLPENAKLFKHEHLLSSKFDASEWKAGLLMQRPVYLVIKKGAESEVLAYFEKNKIDILDQTTYGFKVGANSKCDELINAGLGWIMDLASQNTADQIELKPDDKVWDACSGAGGKALFLQNKYDGKLNLTCSDKRLQILENLKKRFKQLRFPMPHIELTDLTDRFQLIEKYDKIILDVPCTGSGTWGRNPEQIRSFIPEQAKQLSKIQKQIFKNAYFNAKSGTVIYYITCSVFAQENEDNVAYFTENYNLNFRGDTYIENRETDVLYIAEFQV